MSLKMGENSLEFHPQGRSQDWSGGGGGGGPKVANVSDGGPTVHQISMLSCYCQGGREGGGGGPGNQ